MELTKQVPQKDLCKRMLELGWDKETNISWYKYLFVPPNEMNKPFLLENSYWDSEDSWGMKSRLSKLYPAPTVAELGEAIGEKGLLKFWNNFPKENTKGLFENLFDLLTNPNVVCNMWIYLKENKLL